MVLYKMALSLQKNLILEYAGLSEKERLKKTHNILKKRRELRNQLAKQYNRGQNAIVELQREKIVRIDRQKREIAELLTPPFRAGVAWLISAWIVSVRFSRT